MTIDVLAGKRLHQVALPRWQPALSDQQLSQRSVGLNVLAPAARRV